MLDKLFGVLNSQTATRIDAQQNSNDFGKALQLNQPTGAEGVTGAAGLDLNSLKLRGTLEDFDFNDPQAQQGIMAMLKNPNVVHALVEMIKQKFGGQVQGV